jgi:hypothetical protein
VRTLIAIPAEAEESMRKLSILGITLAALGLGIANAERAGGAPPSGKSSLQCASGRQIMIRELHNLEVDNTADGAVIKMRAVRPEEAQDLQRLARMMVDCMSEGAMLKK